MSDAGNILSGLSTDVTGAVSGVTVSTDPINIEQLAASDLPYCVMVQDDYAVEHLEWGQERRTWIVLGVVVQDGGTREQMDTKLEAIRDAVNTDPTLGSVVDRSHCAPVSTGSHGDDSRIVGVFRVEAEEVV